MQTSIKTRVSTLSSYLQWDELVDRFYQPYIFPTRRWWRNWLHSHDKGNHPNHKKFHYPTQNVLTTHLCLTFSNSTPLSSPPPPSSSTFLPHSIIHFMHELAGTYSQYIHQEIYHLDPTTPLNPLISQDWSYYVTQPSIVLHIVSIPSSPKTIILRTSAINSSPYCMLIWHHLPMNIPHNCSYHEESKEMYWQLYTRLNLG